MIGLLADSGPSTTQPTTSICSAPPLLQNPIPINYCHVNQDSLISSGVAILITMVLVFAVAARVSTGRPGKLQMVLEFLFDYIKGLIKESVSEGGDFIIPLAATIALYILIANWLDVFPLTRPVQPANADVNQTFAMAIVVILIVQGYSLRVQGVRGYFRRFTKPFEFNWAIRAVFVPLNIVEEVVKPVTLALRLFGNVFAGLVMVELLAELPVFLAWLPVGGWKVFDVIFIGAIQAFIFMLLTIIYFGMAREGLDEEHHHGASLERAATREAS
ncbi:MAG: F0F1 ATP synthase subunit A [Candidatus Dormibacteraeota bacterium]|nr:F0F1 ATP synthase subunit A [Candidatus Dormibacteraeota bacterium]